MQYVIIDDLNNSSFLVFTTSLLFFISQSDSFTN